MRITLVGFGLLAGSIAAAVKQAKLQHTLRAVSSRKTLQKAHELKAADEFFEYNDVKNWLPDSDIIFLCSPIKHILTQIDALKKNANLVSKSTIVSDIGSTKEEICAAGFELPAPFCFVGGHPMAGSEKHSFEHSDPSIFENACWLYCLPENLTELPKPLAEVLHFLGSKPAQISPHEHDFAMAWLSHAPQLLSTSIAAGVSPIVAENYLHLAGKGFKDMTRIAASSWDMWKDILESNKENVYNALHSYINAANDIKDFLKAMLDKQIENEFLKGNKIRHSLEAEKNYDYPLYKIVVHIPDEPDSILKALQPFAMQNINIRDIELMKVREGIGGTLLLAFKAKKDRDKAIDILKKIGVKAICR
ncbi:MAG: prephenate dehydrogenase/arogenate dehydrogenase family protein [Fibromonadaceae bacterium]|nr:prephenate dehydrogenase/arogenate dehydrogenase family protein [Fibromonadaceae bacterium]